MKKFIIIAVTAVIVLISMIGLSVAGTYNTLVSLQTTVEQRNSGRNLTTTLRFNSKRCEFCSWIHGTRI